MSSLLRHPARQQPIWSIFRRSSSPGSKVPGFICPGLLWNAERNATEVILTGIATLQRERAPHVLGHGHRFKAFHLAHEAGSPQQGRQLNRPKAPRQETIERVERFSRRKGKKGGFEGSPRYLEGKGRRMKFILNV